MEEIVKYCEEKYNICLGCPTIQVGTLNYYRSLDPSFSIADPTEQSERVLVHSYDSEYDKENIIDSISGIHVENTKRVVIENVVGERIFPNSLVFCVSRVTDNNYLENARNVSPDYDSYYRISNVLIFAEVLASLIIQNFSLSWFAESVRSQDMTVFDMKRIELVSVHKPVEYVKSKDVHIKETRKYGGSKFEDSINRIVFTKDEKYIKDQEYRFLFYFVHPAIGIMPVKKDPIILPLNPLGRWTIYP